MSDVLITNMQLFAIGLTFALGGPCLLVCAPVLLAYITGTKRRWGDALRDIAIFMSGRLIAYIILGAVAGVSGGLLRQFTGSSFPALFKIAAGVISIMLGIMIFFKKREMPQSCAILGFSIAITPCAPLLALLFEITLISKNALDGALYTLSFGMGTFIAGFIVIGSISGLLTSLPAKFIKSEYGNLILKRISAGLLILLGLTFIWL